MTTGQNSGPYGSRTPGVYINRSTKGFRISSAVNGKTGFGYVYDSDKAITLNKWIKIVVQQLKSGGNWKYSITIDGNIVHEVVNNQAEEFDNVKVYASNTWINAAMGKIRNLQIYADGGEFPRCFKNYFNLFL